MNPDLYPDLAAAGSLAAALEQLVSDLGVDLTVVSHAGGSPVSAEIASSVPGREPLAVSVGAEARRFVVSGWSQGVQLITGATPDLENVVRAGLAWGESGSLRELRAGLPFLHSSERAEAHERGPVAVVEYQWRAMREQAAEAPTFHEFAALVEAAHAELRLRQLYVFSSHWTLGFSSCTRHPFRVEVAIAPSRNGSSYRVMKHPHAETFTETATAEEAVALAVARLPADLGQAVEGTAESLRTMTIGSQGPT
ncbi:DUF6193 family natural product biosynthesis protein [Streptomyces sp. ME02-8801-2C]|uniref:DUF6193 family natural product biosynthesis protein n=1 Tax=Streptomyces sp. ME02-8801-2C TaxID=3028680 RepID=UPI0029A408E2|nr:DUF6193 family natural product biosynthesis protein [Streptomyces sp. ME02-8801-2C]MDX3455692.1 DUF6193 family natural product biosynthesis protein [Streptomyces sp. ME02-8801-2C]